MTPPPFFFATLPPSTPPRTTSTGSQPAPAPAPSPDRHHHRCPASSQDAADSDSGPDSDCDSDVVMSESSLCDCNCDSDDMETDTDTATDSAIVSPSPPSSSVSAAQVVHTFTKPGLAHASLAQQHIDALVAMLPQVPLQFPEMGNPNLVLHPLTSTVNSNSTTPSPFPSYFPPPAHFHRGHTSLRLSLPFPLARTQRIHLYAVGNLIIDGRKYRVHGWLVRTSTLGVRAAQVLVSIDQPVMLVAKIEARTSTRELDYLEGELAVGRLGVVPSGWWRVYAVAVHGPGSVSISPPTPRFHLSVADDWELSTDGISIVSLADLVAFHNPHQRAAAAAAAGAPSSWPRPVRANPLTRPASLAHARTTAPASAQSAATPPRASSLASAIGYLTGAFTSTASATTSRPTSRSGSTPAAAARPMSSQKQDDDEVGGVFPGAFTYSQDQEVDDHQMHVKEGERSVAATSEMKPLRYAELPSRFASRVPVVQGIVQDSW